MRLLLTTAYKMAPTTSLREQPMYVACSERLLTLCGYTHATPQKQQPGTHAITRWEQLPTREEGSPSSLRIPGMIRSNHSS